MTRSRRIGCVLLPFAAGYYLSYLFHTINALIAADLTTDLSLTAADLGLLTSVYFLVFAAAQIPFGILLPKCSGRESLLPVCHQLDALETAFGVPVGAGS